MRIAFIALLASVTLMPANDVKAQQSDPYAWCALYSGRLSGRNCWFRTLEQCQATVSGVGGMCQPNPFYTGRQDGDRRAPRR